MSKETLQRIKLDTNKKIQLLKIEKDDLKSFNDVVEFLLEQYQNKEATNNG